MKRLLVLLAACAVVFAACGGDDGSSVRDNGRSGSASGSASGTGSGTGSASEDSGSLAGIACEPVGNKKDANSTVVVRLNEYTIIMSSQQVAAGTVHFALKNGGQRPHEFLVLRGVTPNDLPLGTNGALDETKLPGGSIVGEVEPFGSGEDCDGTFELRPGTYTVLCNIVEKVGNETVSHLHKGMVTTFTVS
jgi:hypothetical protein